LFRMRSTVIQTIILLLGLPQSSVDELVLGFEKRLRAVIKSGGETIGKV
jgi:hypothetical protein